MPRSIRQIEIYLPLEYNDGTPIAEEDFTALMDQLFDRYGGVTSVHRDFPLQGLWRSEGVVYQDRIVVITAMDFTSRTDLETIRYLQRLKPRLMKKFDQLDVLITVLHLTAI